MLPGINRGVGQSIGMPDVCLTPAAPSPIPVPYPNIAMHSQATGFAMTVKLTMVQALNLGSKIPMTMGDEGGVAHQSYKGEGTFTQGNPIVKIENKPAIMLTAPTTGNKQNNPAGAVLVPSATNVFFTRATARAAAAGRPSEAGLLGDGVGWVRLSVVPKDADRLLFNHLRALGPVCELVLDLRGNPGGELCAAVRLAGALLPAGAVVAELVDPDGDAWIYRAPRVSAVAPLPAVTVLVDAGTASAAEVIAGALQSNGRAHVVGGPTYGKSAVHVLVGFPSGPGVAGHMRRPDGGRVDGVGVLPDETLQAWLASGAPAARAFASRHDLVDDIAQPLG